ncbi:LPS assembly lipoprotein LptE [Gymnodinialimonas hymeniacidonis]|uniref:LPS assembly lipoprotein LptE n=1 Tax=Gymnodinialimonas hymeniacidonis TaxID=3126508 RepID=UPI0034C6734F
MSSFNRRLALTMLLAPLAACNFQPVYGPGGSGTALRNQIRLTNPDTRIEFEVLSRFEDRLGTGSTYDLDFAIETGQRDLAIDGAENIGRINVVGSLAFTLREAATGRILQQGEVATFTAYATTDSPVATASARRDAENRLAVALADQLVTRLLAGAPTWS